MAVSTHFALLWSLFLWFCTVESFEYPLSKRAFTGDVCRVWGHQSAVLDGWIYVDFSIATGADPVSGMSVYRIDPFGINLVDAFVPVNTSLSSDIYFSTETNHVMPGTMKGAIWVDKNERLYKYGGYFPDKDFWSSGPYQNLDVRPSKVWELDTKAFTWSKLAQPGGDPVVGARAGGVAFAPDLGLGFYAGGVLTNETDSQFSNWTNGETQVLNTMLTYDMENNSFTNATTPFDPFSLSSLVYVPVGRKGILLSLGGRSVSEGAFNTTTGSTTNRDMDSINIYDIEKKSWYLQRASGQIPRDRYWFCTAVAVASDKSSYSVFIHGGRSMSGREAFSDTFVLSLPSFEFFEIDKGADQVHRFDHTCHLLKNKLFVLGGRDVDQEMPTWRGWQNGACDPGGFVNIFDVNNLVWDTEYDPKAGVDYLVDKRIYRVIGGNEHGCATRSEPEMGWGTAKSNLRELFGAGINPANCAAPDGPTKGDDTETGGGSLSGSARLAGGDCIGFLCWGVVLSGVAFFF